MTSKEALFNLYKQAKKQQRTTKEIIDNKEQYEQIGKDLEVLEILKNHYDKDSELLSSGKFISFSIFSCDDGFEKVKEWLENE